MNDSSSFPAIQALKLARQALRQGQRAEAWRQAKLAAELAPELEEPWLILAALATPEESILFLRRALAINPSSEAARKGMHWAVRRLREQVLAREPASGELQPEVKPASSPQEIADTQPVPVHPTLDLESTQPVNISTTPAALKAKPEARIRSASRLNPLVAGLLLAMVGVLIWLGLPALQSSMVKAPYAARPVGALFKPSLTPSATPTSTPTSTPTPTPTSTPTPTPTATNTPTLTPTDTPPPTETAVVYNEIPSGIDSDEAWIDVDLTKQMVYAYVGDMLVNSFLASTGTWQHPTVTGQYEIYVKYRYTDMAGPGYYLPDVPYTMYFYDGYGLHGTYWHNNFGTPMSHGCINLRTEDAAWLYDFASVGTLVNIHY